MTPLRSVAAVLVALVALPLAACVPAPNPTSTPVAVTVPAQLEPYYAQSLVWKDCGGGMQCTTATAPLDWSNPRRADDIKLALVRHTATGQREGSLFVDPGGPGASGYNFIHDSLDFAVSKDLQSRFDVIGWDPRGVGRSTAVNCYDGPHLDKFLFGIPNAPVGSQAYAQEVTSRAKAFADACLQHSGKLLEFIDTESTVNDLDMLRALAGERKLNYFGYSYGSDIGSHYADRYPKNVGRVVLDGATDPSLSMFQMNLAQTTGFANELRTYLTDCLGSSGCPFHGTVDDATVQIRGLLDGLDKAPIRGADGRELTSTYLNTAIQSALYAKGYWRHLTRAFSEVRQGKSDTAFLLADAYVDRNKDGTYRSNLQEAFIAISCIDYPVVTDPVELTRERDLIAAANPIADPKDLDTLGDVVCQQWPYKFRGQIKPVTGHGAAPVVVVGTTGDPATPYPWAKALPHQLESGVLVTYVGEGHIAYDEGDPCIVGAVDKYFIDGTLPSNGLVCNPSA
jgi:pimeloyl-ACP methyl ester carboxylesterase